MSAIDALPPELLAMCVRLVDSPRELMALCKACRALRALIIADDAIWREAFEAQSWRARRWWAHDDSLALPRGTFLAECAARVRAEVRVDRWHDFRPTLPAVLRADHFASTGRRLYALWDSSAPHATLVVDSMARGDARAQPSVRAAIDAAARLGSSQVRIIVRTTHAEPLGAAAEPVHFEGGDGTPVLWLVGESAAASVRLARPWVFRRGARALLSGLTLEMVAPGEPEPLVIIKGRVGLGARVAMTDCLLRGGATVLAGHGALSAERCRFERAAGGSAVVAKESSELALTRCALVGAEHCGLVAQDSAVVSAHRCALALNERAGVKLVGDASAILTRCRVHANRQMGVLVRDLTAREQPASAEPFTRVCAGGRADGRGAGRALVGAGIKVLAHCSVRENGHAGVACIEYGRLVLQANEVVANAAAGLLIQHSAFVEASRNVIVNSHQAPAAAAAHANAAAAAEMPWDIVISHDAVLASSDRWSAAARAWLPSPEAHACVVWHNGKCRQLRATEPSMLADVGVFDRGDGKSASSDDDEDDIAA